jgi:hypothetical protein
MQAVPPPPRIQIKKPQSPRQKTTYTYLLHPECTDILRLHTNTVVLYQILAFSSTKFAPEPLRNAVLQPKTSLSNKGSVLFFQDSLCPNPPAVCRHTGYLQQKKPLRNERAFGFANGRVSVLVSHIAAVGSCVYTR